MQVNRMAGHAAAWLTIIIWGTTFIATKVLLTTFQPIEILFFRFVLGFLLLLAVCPHVLKPAAWRQELLLAAAGCCGIFLYYLLENIALLYTLASHVGVILAVAPFFTAILSRCLTTAKEPLGILFFAGFFLAMAGIFCISFTSMSFRLHLLGDLLSLAAAFVWACYALLTKAISRFGHSAVWTTGRTFLYGLLFILPVWSYSAASLDISRFSMPVNLYTMVYLGAGASALCFVTWTYAVKRLGAVKTSAYIYMVPVITVSASILLLHEPATWQTGLGAALTIAGLCLSEYPSQRKESVHE